MEMDKFGSTPLDHLPLAMAYVPMQRWQNLYSPEDALKQGTLFTELDLPFVGKERLFHGDR